MADEQLLLFLGDCQSSNGLAGGANRGRFRQRAGEKSSGISNIEFEEPGHDIGNEKPHDGDKYRQDGPAPPISFEIAEEAWADRVADSKQEQRNNIDLA